MEGETPAASDALDGVVVVELSDGWSSAAITGRLLADLGARVLKVELPGGDSLHRMGPQHPGGDTYTAAGLLHLKQVGSTPQSGAELLDAAAAADVVLIDDAWRRHLATLGLGVGELSEVWADRVVAMLTPYGAEGPLGEQPGSELLVQALGGILEVTGRPDGPPTRAGVPLATAGTALIACGAVAAALLRRAQHGVGAWLDQAEFDTVVMMQGNFLPGFFTTGQVPQRVGNVQPLSAPWNSYPTSDGEVVIIAISENLWQRLLAVVGREDLIGDARLVGKVNRVAHRGEVDGLVSAWTSQRTTAEVVRTLEAARIPVSDVVGVDAVLADEVLAERRLLASGAAHGRAVPVPGSMFCGAPGPSAAPLAPHPDGGRRPFAGIRVLEVGGHTAGGMATRLLADLGADVIKVELPQGDNARDTAPLLPDGWSYLWHSWNVGKKSVVLRLDEPDGYAAMQQLVAHSDVLLQNMALDTIEKLRLDPDALRAVNPALVYCGTTGFGMSGSRRYRRAFDTVVQAAAGIMAVTGDAGRPVKTGPSIVDNAAALASVAAVAAALYRRGTRGPGALVDIALFDTAAWLTSEWWPLVWSGATVGPLGNGHPYRILDGCHLAADGHWVATSGTATEARRAAVVAQGEGAGFDAEALSRWIADRPAAQAVDELLAAGVPASLVQSLDEVVAHPLTAERSMLLELEIAGGSTCTILGSPYKLRAEPPVLAPERRIPGLGEHTDHVLEEVLGPGSELLERLRAGRGAAASDG